MTVIKVLNQMVENKEIYFVSKESDYGLNNQSGKLVDPFALY